MKCTAYCQQCGRKHVIDFDPLVPTNAFSDWYVKHAGHAGVGFDYPQKSTKPSWVSWIGKFWRFVKKTVRIGLAAVSVVAVEPTGHAPVGQFGGLTGPTPSMLAAFLHNADIKLAYGSSAAYTITLGALATSSTLVAGRESTAVSNTTNLYLDYLTGGKAQIGTTPTTNTSMELWVYGSVNDTPTYPDVLDGTDSAETITSAGIKYSALRLLVSMAVDSNTSNRDYWMAPSSIAAAHGGLVPKNHGLFFTHNTGVNLNATDGNHVWNYTGVFMTAA